MKSVAEEASKRTAIRGSKTGRPVMLLLDLLGRRMSLRIVWELYNAAAPLTFRVLQTAADTNPGVLNTRLKELRAARIVEVANDGYALTPEGRALVALILPIHAWAEVWAKKNTRAANSVGKVRT